MLGVDLCATIRNQFSLKETTKDLLDVCNYNSVLTQIREYNPEIVFHLAALTDVDRCEREPEEAFQTNVIATRNVALSCRDVGAVMVYVSSQMVHDGLNLTPYTEMEETNPINTYGSTKLEGEKIIQKILTKYFIFRTGWLFGGGNRDKKFVPKIINLTVAGKSLSLVGDCFGNPTYTIDLAQSILEVILSQKYGIYNVVNEGGPVSRFEYGKEILFQLGYEDRLISCVSSQEFVTSAVRPRMEACCNFNLRLNGFALPRDWRLALGEYIRKI